MNISKPIEPLIYYIDTTPDLRSLLYDMDLMPEQLRAGTLDAHRMQVLAEWHRAHFKNKTAQSIP